MSMLRNASLQLRSCKSPQLAQVRKKLLSKETSKGHGARQRLLAALAVDGYHIGSKTMVEALAVM